MAASSPIKLVVLDDTKEKAGPPAEIKTGPSESFRSRRLMHEASLQQERLSKPVKVDPMRKFLEDHKMYSPDIESHFNWLEMNYIHECNDRAAAEQDARNGLPPRERYTSTDWYKMLKARERAALTPEQLTLIETEIVRRCSVEHPNEEKVTVTFKAPLEIVRGSTDEDKLLVIQEQYVAGRIKLDALFHKRKLYEQKYNIYLQVLRESDVIGESFRTLIREIGLFRAENTSVEEEYKQASDDFHRIKCQRAELIFKISAVNVA